MFDKLTPPSAGEIITVRDGLPEPTDRPIVPFIRGDGIGVDITPVMQQVVDAAVEKAYGSAKKIVWFEVYAGDAAVEVYGRGEDGTPNYLPQDTIRAISHYKVAIKGPLTTPIGGGIRSLNVAMRQIMDLFACVRPVRWFRGVPSPVKRPELLNVVIYRENTEDVYAGIEYESDSNHADQLIDILNGWNQKKIRRPSAIGIKPISPFGSERIVRAAIRYALRRGRKSVTMVHKGNIMKFTEGAFRDWGYRLAAREFRDRVVTEEDLWAKHNGEVPEGRIVLKDRIADSMFQQVLTRADEYDVIATMNLNGDYLSDACAAQVGGLGLAPGANIGDEVALFEATHGTAPKYAGQDKVNPGSLILSAHMMLEHLGWNDAADKVIRGIEGAIAARTVTYDLERLMDRAKLLSCSQFAQAIVDHMEDGERRAERPTARAAAGKAKKAAAGKAEKPTKAAGKAAGQAVKKVKKTAKKAVVKAKKATTTKRTSRKKPRR